MSFEVAWRLTCGVFVVVALSGYILARKREREIERERERMESEMLKARDEYRALLKRYTGILEADPTLKGSDAARLLSDLESVCSPQESARRIALAKRGLQEMMRPKARDRSRNDEN